MDLNTRFLPNVSDMNLVKSLGADLAKSAGVDLEEAEETFMKAMGKQGLTQKQVTVNGKHGAYQKMVWVKTGDAPKEDTKSKGNKPEDTKPGGDKEVKGKGKEKAKMDVGESMDFFTDRLFKMNHIDGREADNINEAITIFIDHNKNDNEPITDLKATKTGAVVTFGNGKKISIDGEGKVS